MPFTVSTVLPSDIPHLSTIQWAALLSNSLIQTLYPQGPTPELTAFTRASYQKAIQFPSVRLIKAIDEERGEIVAFAKWIVYPTRQEELDQSSENDTENEEVNPSSEWGNVEVPQKPDGVDERALRAWNAIITKTRTRIMSIRKHSCQSTAGCSLECYFTSIAPALWGRFRQLTLGGFPRG